MKKSDENIAGFFRWTTQANPLSINHVYNFSCVYPVKLKNLKANHNITRVASAWKGGCVYP